MPFAVKSIADASQEEIRAEVEKAAAAMIAGAGFTAGDRVRILDTAFVAANLASDFGVVTGYLPGRGGRASVMCGWAMSGLENEVEFPASVLRKLT